MEISAWWWTRLTRWISISKIFSSFCFYTIKDSLLSLEAALEEKEKEWREVQEAVEAAEDKLVASIQEKSRLQVKLFRKLR